MCCLNSRLLVALLTFGIGVTGVYLWVVGINYFLPMTEIRVQNDVICNTVLTPVGSTDLSIKQKTTVSKYDHPAFMDGLFYFGEYDGALVISFDNQPIPPKENDPDSQTEPGFYDADNNLFHFEKVEVRKNKVYFKTYPVNGIIYEFKGTAYLENNPDYYDPISHIKGSLHIMENGKVIATRKIEFSHAVIC